MNGMKGHHGRHHAPPMRHPAMPAAGMPPAGPIGFMQAEPPQNDMPLGMSSDQMQANQMPPGGDNPQEEMAEQMMGHGQPPQQGMMPDQQKAALIQALMQRQMMMRGGR